MLSLYHIILPSDSQEIPLVPAAVQNIPLLLIIGQSLKQIDRRLSLLTAGKVCRSPTLIAQCVSDSTAPLTAIPASQNTRYCLTASTASAGNAWAAGRRCCKPASGECPSQRLFLVEVNTTLIHFYHKICKLLVFMCFRFAWMNSFRDTITCMDFVWKR